MLDQFLIGYRYHMINYFLIIPLFKMAPRSESRVYFYIISESSHTMLRCNNNQNKTKRSSIL